MKLYRVMSVAEWNDLSSTGNFNALPTTMQTKWFAVRSEDIPAWIDMFERFDKVRHDIVVEIDLPVETLGRMYHVPYLDAIGPAYAIELESLVGVSFRRV